MTETSILERVLSCAKVAAEKRASDIVILDVRKQASFTDYFLLASGSSDRRVQTIAEAVVEKMRELGLRPLGTEGIREGRWALVDYGDWVVHVFYQDARQFFDLEGLWFDAERVEIPPAILESAPGNAGGSGP